MTEDENRSSILEQLFSVRQELKETAPNRQRSRSCANNQVKISELKSTVSEIFKMDRLKSRLEIAEKWPGNLTDRKYPNWSNKQTNKKADRKAALHWHVGRYQEAGRVWLECQKKRKGRKISEWLMSEIYPNLVRNINPQNSKLKKQTEAHKGMS